MRALTVPALTLTLLAGGCTHPEDRRWTAMTASYSITADEAPSVTVYAFAPPKAGNKTGVKDLSDHGQAAWIDALANSPADAAALRKALSAPLESEAGATGSVDRSKLARTLVISVRKGAVSQPGDRLMRTVVTITPHIPAGEAGPPFEFAGYSVVATDTKVQSIAKLETTTDTKLSASLAPGIGGFGDNSVAGELAHSRTTSADITQQYENLGIDILPNRMIITRESERGLDVVGNTLIALTLAAPIDSERAHSAYLAGTNKLWDKGSMLSEGAASMEVQPLTYFARCDLQVDVALNFQLRRITSGREFYTEGKQSVEIVTAAGETTTQTLIRASDAQGALYQILAKSGSAVLVSPPGSNQRRLLFDSFDEAKRMAAWLNAGARTKVGPNGPGLTLGTGALPHGETYHADFYSGDCPVAQPPSPVSQ
ncbi:hypothetical protein EDF57_101893 [Novosphingobium sp. PhB55]|nr:hypothetical protein EDF57_101893 [Novosphingobium sp. PhB55]